MFIDFDLLQIKRIRWSVHCFWSLWSLLHCVAIRSEFVRLQSTRPFFNIAHMINKADTIRLALDRGANAIETDIYFASNATPIYTFHGLPCDCFRWCGDRENLDIFLQRIRAMTTPSNVQFDQRLLLIMMDLKLDRIGHKDRARAGQELATILLTNLYNTTTRNQSIDGSRIRTILSIEHVFDYDFVLGFQNELETTDHDWLLHDHIGWDVGLNDPLFAIESMWKRLDMVYNIWQGDGRSNCLSPFYNLGRLAKIIERRDNPSYFAVKNYIKKVYQWTVDLTVNIRTSLRSNVDAIITNHPERVAKVLLEPEFVNRFRMAQFSDSPWERIQTRHARPSTSSFSSQTRPSSNLSLKLMNGASDMLESFSRFLFDAIRHHTPLRYLYLSTYSPQKRQLKQRIYMNIEN
ncbi:Phospholipase D LspiSicTox-betaIE1ii [Sarcoptes scabiei]|uniref:Phospholipase D LspiSicTox-betaIE1ii n=1 Tax=Sarcoptes scabiei TaxID=52283 RepID=A0A834R7K2_SARSC|nr:Phospholipase D LspiSicTox-betaIE1ii [Sarcoptes scabiei]